MASSPTLKEPTDTDPGDATKWGAPDAVHCAELIKGTHATEAIQPSAIDGTAVTLSAVQQITAAKTFNSSTLKIRNPGDSFSYTIVAAAIGADRNITLPLLTGNDTLVCAAFAQALTNKTIDADNNTCSNFRHGAEVDSPSSGVHGISGDVVGTSDSQILSNKTLTLPQINDTSSDHQYIFAVSELVADRTVTLPLLTGNDTFVFEAHSQTLTNKTIDADNNTISNIGAAEVKADLITGQTDLTGNAPVATTDELLLSDAGVLKKVDVIDLLETIDNLTEDASPASGDYFIMFDSVDNTVKKVDNDNIGGGGSAKSFIVGGVVDGSIANSLTRYLKVGAAGGAESSESATDIGWPLAFTWSNMRVTMESNSLNGVSDMHSRINGADGNQTVQFAASTAGEQEDESNTDAVSDGDNLNWKIVTAGSSGTIQNFRFVSVSTI